MKTQIFLACVLTLPALTIARPQNSDVQSRASTDISLGVAEHTVYLEPPL